MNIKKFPHFRQADFKDCAPTCLKIIAKYYGKVFNIQKLRILCETTRSGSNLKNLASAFEILGFRSLGVKIDLLKLNEATLPCVLHWNKMHFVVLYKIKNNKYYISDPAHGKIVYSKKEFLECWIGNNANDSTREGVTLLIETTPKFFVDDHQYLHKDLGLQFLTKYITKYNSHLVQLLLGLIAGSILQLIFPFLTQSIVDVGIKNQNVNFIYIILIAQLFLFFGRTSIEVLRGWILLHLSARINISLISDFFIKLMSLPIAFFDVRMTGDLMQRINDHKKIEQILTNSSLNVLFSLVNLIIFGIVLAWYNTIIFLIFLLGSLLYFFWISIFLKKRRDLNYKRFAQDSQEQSKVIEIINGMQEIKLHNAEMQKRWEWEYLQARLFTISTQSLTLEQYQTVGSSIINELKNIFITIVAAQLVINQEITIGMMMAITYIVGQLNSPISMLINFMQELQDAKISLERLSEIHLKEDEQQNDETKTSEIDLDGDITFSQLSFRYTGSYKNVLENITLNIPANKTTAIVGVSGSGKTTLMKLLLKFYEPIDGNIKIKDSDLSNITQKAWRNQCGTVMQEGYVFNDTIAGNIAIGHEEIDREKLNEALVIANIKDFVDSLPLSYNTKIGMEGIGLSTGQKQRILIARAVYKNPKFLFFDEATSSLDANNEKKIMENLDEFFKQRTVVIVAHRLSTVKNAHQIIVLKDGLIAEIGNHKELVKKKGNYYELVKNQLELGN